MTQSALELFWKKALRIVIGTPITETTQSLSYPWTFKNQEIMPYNQNCSCKFKILCCCGVRFTEGSVECRVAEQQPGLGCLRTQKNVSQELSSKGSCRFSSKFSVWLMDRAMYLCVTDRSWTLPSVKPQSPSSSSVFYPPHGYIQQYCGQKRYLYLNK